MSSNTLKPIVSLNPPKHTYIGVGASRCLYSNLQNQFFNLFCLFQLKLCHHFSRLAGEPLFIRSSQSPCRSPVNTSGLLLVEILISDTSDIIESADNIGEELELKAQTNCDASNPLIKKTSDAAVIYQIFYFQAVTASARSRFWFNCRGAKKRQRSRSWRAARPLSR